MKYGGLTLGQIEAIVNRLGGMEGVRRLLAGEAVVISASSQTFNVWKTIKLGTGLKTAGDFRQALKDAGFHFDGWTNNILCNPAFVVAAEETEIDLVVVSVSELGFKKKTRRDEIYDRARKLGLELCPVEVGPQLRLQHSDQPLYKSLHIGMEPIACSPGDLRVFDVECSGSGLLLYACYGDPGYFWPGSCRWVFYLPRKKGF